MRVGSRGPIMLGAPARGGRSRQNTEQDRCALYVHTYPRRSQQVEFICDYLPILSCSTVCSCVADREARFREPVCLGWSREEAGGAMSCMHHGLWCSRPCMHHPTQVSTSLTKSSARLAPTFNVRGETWPRRGGASSSASRLSPPIAPSDL
ncbi:hypothetical protein L227DRAFT_386412 [Lentinus tigrinus ALCF2SS1-6]|uniref:Uncharacterized protein n=1 Tax=Lentinus tigrinus ALCF2SS1-6 TaxID=1328759 RepID=A0A5C2SHU3_9APHY|nr:hypothetical protein L227DRAFT_386412 [Lentinus tigrinus ALCF2SS1-6]